MAATMTHDDVVLAIAALAPGVEFSYDGDGSSLDPVYDGDVLVSRGLEWHSDAQQPTMKQIAAGLSTARAAVQQAVADRDAFLTKLQNGTASADEVQAALAQLLAPPITG